MSIKTNAAAIIKDVNGSHEMTLEVNFDKSYKDCIKIKISNNELIVKYSELFSFLFVLANKEQQAKMIPVQRELGNEYLKQIKIKCKKDMKEGEELVVNVKIHVPTVVEDEIKHQLLQKELSTGLPLEEDKV